MLEAEYIKTGWADVIGSMKYTREAVQDASGINPTDVKGQGSLETTEELTEAYKTCSKCRVSKPHGMFQKRSASKDGLQAYCRDCNKQVSQEWREDNPEYDKLYGKLYYTENRERILAESKKYYAENREQQIKNAKAWNRANPEKRRLYKRKRRAQIMNAPGTHTAEDLQRLRNTQKHCQVCRVDLSTVEVHIDHKIPLSRGGSNDPDNLALLCSACNLSKSAKTPVEYAQTLTGLQKLLYPVRAHSTLTTLTDPQPVNYFERPIPIPNQITILRDSQRCKNHCK